MGKSEGLKVEEFEPRAKARGREDVRDVRENLYESLTGEQKDISAWPKYLYNERGSELFEKITEQPEYYQTRTELSILERSAGEITEGHFTELVELGSGSSSKTGVLLESMIRRQGADAIRYIPLDVSESAVEEGAQRLRHDYPGIRISGHVGDFDGAVEEFLSSLSEADGRRIVIFLGGTIGNFTASGRERFLEGVKRGLRPGDRFLVGVDLVKDVETLEAAYNDASGMTAEFNRNVLSSINEKVGSNFDPEGFEHRALYNQDHSRIEMRLVSAAEQEVDLGSGLRVRFGRDEYIRTEISNKFTRETAALMFEGSGMSLVDLYTDERELFGVALAEPE